MTGLSPATIHNAEGGGSISRRTKKKIASVLGVDPLVLFGGDKT